MFCDDSGAVADWCVEVLGFIERERWPDDDGVVRNVELAVGDSEILVHLIEEYSRHNGHADLLCEVVDGATGE